MNTNEMLNMINDFNALEKKYRDIASNEQKRFHEEKREFYDEVLNFMINAFPVRIQEFAHNNQRSINYDNRHLILFDYKRLFIYTKIGSHFEIVDAWSDHPSIRYSNYILDEHNDVSIESVEDAYKRLNELKEFFEDFKANKVEYIYKEIANKMSVCVHKKEDAYNNIHFGELRNPKIKKHVVTITIEEVID